MYIKSNTPYGEFVVWLNISVVKAMVQFLEEEGVLERLSKREKDLLYGENWKKKDSKNKKEPLNS